MNIQYPHARLSAIKNPMRLYADILTYFSIFIWLLPPLRQYKKFLFYYFLILAVSDLAGVLLFSYFNIEFFHFYIIVSFGSFVALQQTEYIAKKKILFLSSGLIVVALSFVKLEIWMQTFLFTFLHLLIIFRILYLFVMAVAQKQSIDFFYLVLAFYEFTVLLKFLNFLFEINVDAQTYFYITTGFELLVGIFFTMFREESPKLVYKLK